MAEVKVFLRSTHWRCGIMRLSQPRAIMSSFDAVFLIAFGGLQGLADIRPFLARVLEGRHVAPARA